MPDQDLANAARLLQSRDFGEAAARYLRVVNDTPEAKPAWEGLFAALAGLGMADKALALVETRQQRFSDGLSFYFHAIARIVASGLADIAVPLIAATPHD